MLRLYDHLDALLEQQEMNTSAPRPLKHLATELMDELGYCSEEDLNRALLRSFEVCCAVHIQISANFKKVYRYRDNQVFVDWQLSDLACYLLLINGNSCNPNVAKAQLNAVISRRGQ